MNLSSARFQSVFSLCLLFFFSGQLVAQGLPDQMYFSSDETMLMTGGQPSTGAFDESIIRTFELQFDQANYWNILQQNYNSGTELMATLTIDGEVFDSVGVRFKGLTSYFLVQFSDKKSFNISLNSYKDQKWMGYDNFNLNNCFQDPSMMRDVLFLHMIRNYIPAARASYVHLYINGQDWGLYPNLQQLDGDYIEEWFPSNDGIRWRADRPDGSFGGGGPGWGDGTAALNYLGPDTSTYQEYYTLKKSGIENPWDKLLETCDALESTPIGNLETVLPNYMDVDRALWFLATEILFSDDDSYVHKGKMDYYLYWDVETNRMVPLEYDGNSVMAMNHVNWSAFYNANDSNYPLLNRVLAVPAYRQRYLAHLRTMIYDLFDPVKSAALVDSFAIHIDSLVQADPIKLGSYNAFVNEQNTLKNFMTNRRNVLLANNEVNQEGPQISNVYFETLSGGDPNEAPGPNEAVFVHATIEGAAGAGVSTAMVYYGTGIQGHFNANLMYDDGMHNDGAAGDGHFTGGIPGHPEGTLIRYYVEAVSTNSQGSRSYLPEGAEHDVFVYEVVPASAAEQLVVINEIMASNSTTASDEAGEFDDWIELYNISGATVDLGGYFVTDNPFNLTKWQIPEGTLLGADEYLIIWADEDGSQGDLHANFRLSSSGESVTLLSPDTLLVDQMNFESQTTDLGYARVPNGTGNFVIQGPTFQDNNDLAASIGAELKGPEFQLYPNPASQQLQIRLSDHPMPVAVHVFNVHGQTIWQGTIQNEIQLDVADWTNGIYLVSIEHGVKRLLINH